MLSFAHFKNMHLNISLIEY